MPYTKTTWVDEIPASTPVKYVVTDDVLGEVAGSATIALVTSVTPGTALNAVNLNKIETGIETAQDAAEAAQIDADAAAATANVALPLAVGAIPKSLVTTAGDLIYATASAVLARLAKPAADAILKMTSAGVPSWKAITDFLPGTTAGDLEYYTASQVKTRLANTANLTLMSSSDGIPRWLETYDGLGATNTSYDGDAVNVGTYTVGLSSWGIGAPTGPAWKAAVVKVSAKWAAASDGTTLEIQSSTTNIPTGTVRAMVANYFNDVTCVVPLEGTSIKIVVAGANTTATYITIIGLLR